MHRLRGGGESVALEYYFRAIDEFTTLTSQLFDEAFSFFFFWNSVFWRDFFFDGWRYSRETRFKGWNLDRVKFDKSEDV